MSIRKSLYLILFPLLAGPALCGSVLAAPVDINSADANTLAAALKGVGAKTASEIVSHRKRNGPFETPDDLLEVKGIGPRTLEVNRNDILTGTGSIRKVAPEDKAKP